MVSRCLYTSDGCQEVGLKRRFSGRNGRAGGHPRRHSTRRTHTQSGTPQARTTTHRKRPRELPSRARTKPRERGQKRSLTRHEKRSLTRGPTAASSSSPNAAIVAAARRQSPCVRGESGLEPREAPNQDHPNQMSAWINPTVCAEMGPKNVTQAGSRRTLRSSDSDALSGGSVPVERSVTCTCYMF